MRFFYLLACTYLSMDNSRAIGTAGKQQQQGAKVWAKKKVADKCQLPLWYAGVISQTLAETEQIAKD